MKKIVNTVDGEGIDALLGENVLIFCMNYIYAGKLTGVDETCIQLHNAQIVFETGPFASPNYKDAQDLPCGIWYIQTAAIESFGRGKNDD